MRGDRLKTVLHCGSVAGRVQVGFAVHRNGEAVLRFSVGRGVPNGEYDYNGVPMRKHQVRTILLRHGIDISFPERFVVAQHATARLLDGNLLPRMESLLGTAAMASKCDEMTELIRRHTAVLTDLHNDLRVVATRRRALSPVLDECRGIVDRYRKLAAAQQSLQQEREAIRGARMAEVHRLRREVSCSLVKRRECERELAAVRKAIRVAQGEVERRVEVLREREAQQREMERTVGDLRKAVRRETLRYTREGNTLRDIEDHALRELRGANPSRPQPHTGHAVTAAKPCIPSPPSPHWSSFVDEEISTPAPFGDAVRSVLHSVLGGGHLLVAHSLHEALQVVAPPNHCMVGLGRHDVEDTHPPLVVGKLLASCVNPRGIESDAHRVVRQLLAGWVVIPLPCDLDTAMTIQREVHLPIATIDGTLVHGDGEYSSWSPASPKQQQQQQQKQ
eukprot:Sspe_Gene.44911::Locus_22098_Transcript_1_1_Confidence_1.000_Length_1551::g.44911::m.44911